MPNFRIPQVFTLIRYKITEFWRISGQRIFPVGGAAISGVLRGKSEHEEFDIPHTSELCPESLYLGIE